MKIPVLVLSILLLSQVGRAQTFGPRQIIDEDGGNVRMVRTADFDGDNDLDVVIAATNNIAWYENMDGLGTFGEPITIQEGMQQSFGLFPADINGDEHIDLVVAYLDESTLAWYRNLGDGSFSPLQSISIGIDGTLKPNCYDLDSDGDLDIVLGLANTQGLYWFENLGGNGISVDWEEHVINVGISQARTQAIGDIDGDNDPDILTNAVGSSYLSWFENLDGEGNFGPQIIIDTVGLYENSVNLVDLDGDGDLDILSQKNDLVIWRENLDGMGSFSAYNVISDQAFIIQQVIPIDADNDGDFDVVSVSAQDNKVAWYENFNWADSFGPQKIVDANLFAPRTVNAADMDGDGDLDLLSAALSASNKQVVWYENLTILNVGANETTAISIYPNPVEEVLTIANPTAVTIESLALYDAMGRKVLESNQVSEQVAVSHLSAGVYFLHVSTDGGTVIKRVVKK